MKILFIGPQGCGKGTIAEMLSSQLHVPYIAVGQLLRNIPVESPIYVEIHKYLDVGELVPITLLGDVLKSRLKNSDCTSGFILDGWGRQMIDINFYDPGFDKVIFLKIAPETSIYRLASRRTCKKCGKIFNLNTVKPKVFGLCDLCGGELMQREDDTESAIRRRLDIFSTQTMEVINYFRGLGILVEIDAEPLPPIVFQAVLDALNL